MRRDASDAAVSSLPEWTEEQFHSWAAGIRDSVKAIDALVERVRVKRLELDALLESPRPDLAAIGKLTLQISGCRKRIERILGQVPTLGEVADGRSEDPSGPGPASPCA